MNLNDKTVILASASPRRRELLKNIVDSFVVETADIDENLPIDTAEILVEELAVLKACAVNSRLEEKETANNKIIIAADTVVVYDSNILGKPNSKEEATNMLNMLSNNSHCVMTGVCVIDTDNQKLIARVCKTKVVFRKISQKEIDAYVQTGSPMDKAGAYGIQDESMNFVKEIVGDYYNVVGLPLKLLNEMICEM